MENKETTAQASQNKSVCYLSTPHQLFIKFGWELGNLSNVINEQYHSFSNREHEQVGYHVFNTAVTAWHLADWTWISLTDESKRRLSDNFGSRIEDLKSFKEALKKKYRALEICQEIANGSKHLERHKNAKADAEFKVKVKSATAGELKAGQSLQTISYDFVIHWENQTLRIVDIFEEARNSWHDVLVGIGCAGPIYLESLVAITKVNRGQAGNLK